MHLFGAGPVGVHSGGLRPLVHSGEFVLGHGGIPGHEIDPLKDTNAPTFQALELDGLRVFPCVGILFDVDDVVREFYPKSLLAEDSLGVVRVDPTEQEIVGSVRDGALVPRESS